MSVPIGSKKYELRDLQVFPPPGLEESQPSAWGDDTASREIRRRALAALDEE